MKSIRFQLPNSKHSGTTEIPSLQIRLITNKRIHTLTHTHTHLHTHPHTPTHTHTHTPTHTHTHTHTHTYTQKNASTRRLVFTGNGKWTKLVSLIQVVSNELVRSDCLVLIKTDWISVHKSSCGIQSTGRITWALIKPTKLQCSICAPESSLPAILQSPKWYYHYVFICRHLFDSGDIVPRAVSPIPNLH